RDLLIVTMLALASSSAVAATVLDRRWCLTIVPVAICVAWILYAGDAFHGSPDWYTIPIGLALLAAAEPIRTDAARMTTRSNGGREPLILTVSFLDAAGAAALVAPPLVRSVAGDVPAALLAGGASV